jgi:hypothetical protein
MPSWHKTVVKIDGIRSYLFSLDNVRRILTTQIQSLTKDYAIIYVVSHKIVLLGSSETLSYDYDFLTINKIYCTRSL